MVAFNERSTDGYKNVYTKHDKIYMPNLSEFLPRAGTTSVAYKYYTTMKPDFISHSSSELFSPSVRKSKGERKRLGV
jgi:hypothetical protein